MLVYNQIMMHRDLVKNHLDEAMDTISTHTLDWRILFTMFFTHMHLYRRNMH